MIPSFLLIWFSSEPPSSHHPSSSSSSKTKKHSLFCSWRLFQKCCLLPESNTAPLFLYFRLKRWTSWARPFKQKILPGQRAAFVLFLVLFAASGLCRAPKRCDSRPGHLEEPVVSFASCHKCDGTKSESLPLPILPPQLCFVGMLSRIFLPAPQRVAIICFS